MSGISVGGTSSDAPSKSSGTARALRIGRDCEDLKTQKLGGGEPASLPKQPKLTTLAEVPFGVSCG